VREVIEHGVNGLLFDFFDVDALSRHVVDVLDALMHTWILVCAHGSRW